jgi:SAM-dependent methyltransferase
VELSHLQKLRAWELDLVVRTVPLGSRILEVGAGTGWQAKMLSERGFDIVAIDLADAPSEEPKIWPVQAYNGRILPFETASFDVIFSSNVLEHVAQVEEFQSELRRVLRPGGLAIHVLPTPAWRFWSCLTHYPSVWTAYAKQARALLRGGNRGAPAETTRRTIGGVKKRMLTRLLVPDRHGARGWTALSELLLFSRRRWLTLFRRAGWIVEQCYPTRLFYSGYAIFGSRLGLNERHRASYVLGSACYVYVLRALNNPLAHGLGDWAGKRDALA